MLTGDVSGLLARGRAAAEFLMVDACTITRAGEGKGPFNDATGKYDKPDRVEVYSGKCQVQIQSVTAGATDSDAGDRLATVQVSELKLPVVGTEGVSIKDVAEITSSAHDSSLVGRMFTVKARHEKSLATSRRLPVEEITA